MTVDEKDGRRKFEEFPRLLSEDEEVKVVRGWRRKMKIGSSAVEAEETPTWLQIVAEALPQQGWLLRMTQNPNIQSLLEDTLLGKGTIEGLE